MAAGGGNPRLRPSLHRGDHSGACRSTSPTRWAIAIRCSVVGWLPNQNCDQAGGVGSLSDRSASCRCIATNAAGSSVATQRVHVGPGLDLPADRVLHRARQQGPDRHQGQHPRHHRAGVPHRRPARRAGPSQPGPAGRPRTAAPAAPSSEPVRTSSWRAWPSSWATTDSAWSSRQVVDQVVVEHHPAGAAEAGHVGVQRRRTPRRVGHQHVVDLHPLLVGQLEDRGPQRTVRQRGEVVEQRLDQHRVDERARPSPGRARAGGDRRPGTPPPTGAADEDEQQRSTSPTTSTSPRPRQVGGAARPRPGASGRSRDAAPVRARSRTAGSPRGRPAATRATRDQDPHPPPAAQPVHEPCPEPGEAQPADATSETASEAQPSSTPGPASSPRRGDLRGGEDRGTPGRRSAPPGTGCHGTSRRP